MTSDLTTFPFSISAYWFPQMKWLILIWLFGYGTKIDQNKIYCINIFHLHQFLAFWLSGFLTSIFHFFAQYKIWAIVPSQFRSLNFGFSSISMNLFNINLVVDSIILNPLDFKDSFCFPYQKWYIQNMISKILYILTPMFEIISLR